MTPPPLLLGAALLFWGWQTGFPAVGAVMAVVLEGARYNKARWEFSNADFGRIWTFCALLLLGSLVYAFTANEGPSDFLGLLQNPTLANQRHAGTAGARTVAVVIRWLPMVFFSFLAAQAYSARQAIPLEIISAILRRRWRRAQRLGQPLPPSRGVNVSWPYFGLCLFAAAIHTNQDGRFFWGLCALMVWALWPQRSRRFGLPMWAAAMVAAILLGYFGQGGLARFQRYLENFSPAWLTSFLHPGFDATQSKTALGQIGRAKTSGKIVIRVEPQENRPPPSLLREASYRTYRVQVWYAGNARSEYEQVASETNHTTWVLLPKTNNAKVNIACYLDSWRTLLPLPTDSGRLENLPAFVLQKNKLGAVLAVGPGLVVFDACYGPGATIDAEPDEKEDLFVSPREQPALAQVLSELQLTNQNLGANLRAITGFFQDKFRYSLWQELRTPFTTNETPLARFLLRERAGHCEYFATATVLLLRQMGIPARYAVGYSVHEISGGKYVVRARDAHAWCLVWNKDKAIWQDFDTTPASWVEAESKRASPLQFLSDAFSRVIFEFSKLRWGQTRLRQYILWALLPVLALLLYQIIFRSRRQRQQVPRATARFKQIWPGLDSEFYQVEKELTRRGLERGPSEPLVAWISRAAPDPILSHVRDTLQHALKLHYRLRFDPLGLSASERDLLRRNAKACLTALAIETEGGEST